MRQQHGMLEQHDLHSHATGREPTPRQFGAKPGVLVVDREHLVQAMVQLGLERSGFEVLLASNGRKALDLYRAHCDEIAVVLLDLRLPDLTGPEMLAALRERNPGVRICFMTSGPGAYEPEELLKQGARHIIAKPFLLTNLVNILRPLAQGACADSCWHCG